MLPIKKLVKDIGDLNNLTIKETKKIETTDSKIHNFSILTTSKMNIRLIDQIKIEGFQNFQQYLKTNPINVRINDSEIWTKLMFYTKNINIVLLPIVYYLVMQLKKIRILFLFQQMVWMMQKIY